MKIWQMFWRVIFAIYHRSSSSAHKIKRFTRSQGITEKKDATFSKTVPELRKVVQIEVKLIE